MSKKVKTSKTKKEIVSDMMAVRDAERRRALIKDVIFPYLIEMNENIAYSKVFLQALSSLIEGVFEETRKSTTIGNIKEGLNLKLSTIFTLSDPQQKKEYERYKALLDKLQDASIQDIAYATELPRYIDGYITKTEERKGIETIDIMKILG